MLTRSQNPIKTIKKNGFIALLMVTVLYILANVAYFAAGEWSVQLYIQNDTNSVGKSLEPSLKMPSR